jgi:hypothetical protein
MHKRLVAVNLLQGVANPYRWTFSKHVNKVCEALVDISQKCDSTIVVNDRHRKTDPELKFIPPHFLDGEPDSEPINSIIGKLKLPMVLSKNRMSCLSNAHNTRLILDGADNFILGGFHLTTDIIPTCLAFLDHGLPVSIHKDAVGDVDNNFFDHGLRYLSFLGVKIL